MGINWRHPFFLALLFWAFIVVFLKSAFGQDQYTITLDTNSPTDMNDYHVGHTTDGAGNAIYYGGFLEVMDVDYVINGHSGNYRLQFTMVDRSAAVG